MRRTTTEVRYLSVAEYLQREEVAEVRHEYVAGGVHALAGATKRHNLIAGNLFHALRGRVSGTSCAVYMSDVKLQAANDVYYYPDVMVACGAADDDATVEHAPCMVVEVTSPSTETIDRREKLIVYRRLPTLRAYLIVDQATRGVDRHWRSDSGAWRHERVEGEGRVHVPCPEGELTLDAVYEGTGVKG